MYLLDTNVVSELRRPAGRVDVHVAAWAAGVDADQLYLSVVTLGEIRRGIELLRPKDPIQAARLDRWLATLARYHYVGRILDVTEPIADVWGRAGRDAPRIDGLIAATAIAHGLIVVTRNTADFATTGVRTLDPWLPV